MNEEG